MITKTEMRITINHWMQVAADKDAEVKDLKQRLLAQERYCHVNEDMALSLARSYDAIDRLSATLAMFVNKVGR
jgi:hypothetical protein